MSDGQMHTIKIEGLTVRYATPKGEVTALQAIDLQLNSGQIYGLVGPNGSGKSTLFKSIMGLISPTTGEVTINDAPIKAALKEGVLAYVPQTEAIDWDFPISVYEVVMMGRYHHLGWLRRPRAIDHQVVETALARVNLTNYRQRQIGALSGGQRKRVFVARALAQQSPILLLDEPFTGVDQRSEHEIITLLRGLKKEGYLILLSTHNLGSIPLFCDEVILLNQQLYAQGVVDNCFTRANLEALFGCDLRALLLTHPEHQCGEELFRELKGEQG